MASSPPKLLTDKAPVGVQKYPPAKFALESMSQRDFYLKPDPTHVAFSANLAYVRGQRRIVRWNRDALARA